MVKKIFLAGVFVMTGIISYCQQPEPVSPREQKKLDRKERLNNIMKQYEEGSLVYSRQSAFGFKLNTDGWGAFYEHGKYITIDKTNLWWIELGERKSQKEGKIPTATDIGGGFILIGNPYVFGKQNNFYYLKGGIGQQRLIGDKGNKNGVAVAAIYGGGLSLGYLKPYYLDVRNAEGKSRPIKYSDSVRTEFLDPGRIDGTPGFTKGFTEGTFVPGAFGRLALRFDYGRYNEFLSALEVGLNAEYYTKKMPIMIDVPEKQFFFNAYVAIEFGSRK